MSIVNTYTLVLWAVLSEYERTPFRLDWEKRRVGWDVLLHIADDGRSK